MSTKRKGMSAADKRTKILEMFHTSKRPFTKDEVEKEGQKTGVVRSAVLDVNQMLVDDGLVECEKIGSTNWYWSFPSKQAQGLSVHATSLTESVVCERAAIAETKTRLESASAVRPESDDRSAKLQQLSALKSDISEFERQVEALKENDPAEIEKMENNITLCRDASNRWTDNLLQVRTWMVKKKGMSTKEAKDTLKQMGVPTELDYVK